MRLHYPKFMPYHGAHEIKPQGSAHAASHGRPSPAARVASRPFPRIIGLLFVASAAVTILVISPLLQASAQTQPPGPALLPPPDSVSPAPLSSGFDRRESVLDRFREFKGEKTKEALSALFVRMDPAFTQEPSILLSDGSATARVSLRVPYRKGDTPRFSISGGRVITVRAADNGLWILEILPERGSMATSVTVLSGGTMTEYPLTVAPPLNLLDPRRLEVVEIEYAVLANELAAARSAPQK